MQSMLGQIKQSCIQLAKPINLHSLRSISTTCVLNAMPPKKKRRMDPAMLKTKVEKKIRKHEREIAKLEAAPRQLIPILEYQLNNSQIRDLEARPGRTFEEIGTSQAEYKAAIRLWAMYCTEQSKIMRDSINRVESSQTRALETLKELDEELYKRTVAYDEFNLIPHESSHIKKETPANPKYKSPDGYIKNTTKDWVM